MKRIPARPSALVILLVSAVIGLAGPGCGRREDTRLPEEDRLLEDVMEDYVTERFRFYPVESTLAGLPGNDDRLGSFSGDDMRRRILWLTDFHQRLMGLRLTALSQPAYLDAIWLTSLVKSELFELEQRRLWTLTASYYGEPLRLGLASLLAEGDLEARVDALFGRLRGIPELVARARENLRPAAGVFRTDGLRSLENCRLLLRDLPEMLEDRLPPHQVAELAELSRRGARALQELIRFVPQGQRGVPEEGFALGPERLSRYFLYQHMVDRPLDSLARVAEDELRRATGELTEYALKHFPARPLRALLAQKPLASAPWDVVAAAEKRVLSFLRERHETGAPEASIPVGHLPDYFPGREPVRLWRPRALEPEHGTFLMVREAASADESELERLTLREVAGRSRQYAYQAAAGSLLRRVVSSETTSEGWLSELEQTLLSEGFAPGNERLRLRHHHERVIALVRLLAVFELHGEGRGLDDVVSFVHDRAFLTFAEARAEAERAAVDPSVANVALGRMLYRELARDYTRIHPLARPAEIEDRLLARGLLPMKLLRFQLLGADGEGFD